jgi:hypothetical protein
MGYWSNWREIQSEHEHVNIGQTVLDAGHYDPGDNEKIWDIRICFKCAIENELREEQ